MKVHGWYRIASKIAVNSYHTKLRNHQKKTWGWTFEITMRANDEKVTAENSVYEVVDVGEHLPKRVISDMSRVDGTKFVIRRCSGESLSNDERLQWKLESLYAWARKHGFDNAAVQNKIDKYCERDVASTFKSPVRTAAMTGRCRNDDDNEGRGVARNQHANLIANMATMAPRRKCDGSKAAKVTKKKRQSAVGIRHSPRNKAETAGMGGGGKKDNCKKLTLEQVKEQDADKIAKFLELPAAKVKSQPIV